MSSRRVLYKLLLSQRFSPIITVILCYIPGLDIPVTAVDSENKYGKGNYYRKKTQTLLKIRSFFVYIKFLFFHSARVEICPIRKASIFLRC